MRAPAVEDDLSCRRLHTAEQQHHCTVQHHQVQSCPAPPRHHTQSGGKLRLVVALQVIFYRLILYPGPATLSEAQGLVLVYSYYLSDLPNPWRLPAKPNHCKTSSYSALNLRLRTPDKDAEGK